MCVLVFLYAYLCMRVFVNIYACHVIVLAEHLRRVLVVYAPASCRAVRVCMCVHVRACMVVYALACV